MAVRRCSLGDGRLLEAIYRRSVTKAVLYVAVLGIVCAGAAQETGESVKPRARPPATVIPQRPTSAAPEDVQALAADIEHMRNILEQMEMNLGLLPAGATPTKHQFELEIDMWRAMLDHMDRRLQAMRAASSK